MKRRDRLAANLKSRQYKHILFVNISLMMTSMSTIIFGGQKWKWSSSGSEVDALPEIPIEMPIEIIANIKQFFTIGNIMQSFVNFCATIGGECYFSLSEEDLAIVVFFINFIIFLILLTFQLGSAERPYGLCAVGLGLAMTHSVISRGIMTDGSDPRSFLVLFFIIWITLLTGAASQFSFPEYRRYSLCAAGLGFAIGGGLFDGGSQFGAGLLGLRVRVPRVNGHPLHGHLRFCGGGGASPAAPCDQWWRWAWIGCCWTAAPRV